MGLIIGVVIKKAAWSNSLLPNALMAALPKAELAEGWCNHAIWKIYKTAFNAAATSKADDWGAGIAGNSRNEAT